MTSTPSTVAGVIDRLRAIDQDLPAHDGAAVFNRMYLTITERVATSLDSRGFKDPAFMADLDVRFALLWLDAYAAATAGDPIPKAWAPLFEQRDAEGLLPVQYAVGGMNAHIEHDLPLAVVQTCLARRATPRRRAVRDDYEAVNAILAEVESDVRRSFLSEVGLRLDEEVGPVVHLVSSWNIDKARDLAWVSVEALWTLRRLELLYERYVAALASTVGMASRCLLTPVLVSL